MAVLDAIANNITSLANGDLVYVAEDLGGGSYQDGKAALSVIKSYTLTSPNGTTPQGAYFYNTYTDASNYERFYVGWNGSNVMRLEMQVAGTGDPARSLHIGAGAAISLTFGGGDFALGRENVFSGALTLDKAFRPTSLLLQEGTPPGTPGANNIFLYAEDNGSGVTVLRTKDSAGTVTTLGGGASAPLTLASGTLTDPSTALTISATYNDGADAFKSLVLDITNTASSVGSRPIDMLVGGTSMFSVDTGGAVRSQGSILKMDSSNELVRMSSSGVGVSSIMSIYFTNTYNIADYGYADTQLNRIDAGILGIRGTSSSVGAAINFVEQTAPSAPSANQVVIYAEDNGSGKTRLMARFNTGAAQQIAIEP